MSLPPRTFSISYGIPASETGRESYRRALIEARKAADAEQDDLPKLVSLWFAERPGETVDSGYLVRLALREGLLKHTLRPAIFRIRCARLAELLGRAALAQGPDGLVPGLRFRVSDQDKRVRGWIVRRTEDAERAVAEERRRDARATAEADARDRARRRRVVGRGSRGHVNRS